METTINLEKVTYSLNYASLNITFLYLDSFSRKVRIEQINCENSKSSGLHVQYFPFTYYIISQWEYKKLSVYEIESRDPIPIIILTYNVVFKYV